MADLVISEMALEDFEAAEAVIRGGLETFVDVGQALLAIRDGRGYRHRGFASFEAYCFRQWQFSRPHAYRLMDAAEVAGILSPIGDTPANEAQARALAPLLERPAELAEAWREAVETAPDGQLTARHVAAVVERHAKPLPGPDSRPMPRAALLRFSQDLPTPSIVSLILRVHFPDAETALDLTYGLGGFWDGSAHVQVTAHDLRADRSPGAALDLRSVTLAYGPKSFDVVFVDPPQVADAGDDSIMGQRFGSATQAELKQLIIKAASVAWLTARVGMVFKVCDHIHAQQFQMETDWVREALGGRVPYDVVHQVRSAALVDPRWEEQLSARNNGATFLIFRRGDQRHVRRERREKAAP